MNARDPRDLAARFGLREERFSHGSFAVSMLLPESSEALIDVSAFNVDERLPYWAELWPSARALARSLLEASELPPRAVELGCGVALPSLALRHRGVDVLATDWYADALEFAEANALRNGCGPLRTRLFDWRSLPGGMGRFPLVVAADVLYEARNVELVAAAVARLVIEGGTAWIADPGRTHLADFERSMRERGWRVDGSASIAPVLPERTHLQREPTVRILRLRPPRLGDVGRDGR